ncbi:MAG: tetratricopeptide repeat protein [Alphaproteobacteria bacterium]|nr:tetratricopeptide repeat protein [Alphaproteobacteria bacterium]
MKKTSVKKTTTAKKRTNVRPVASKSTIKNEKAKPCFNPWSLSIYVYWFIILFFIAATFYILGRSHNTHSTTSNVEITEEVLLQSADFYKNAQQKLKEGDIETALTDLTAAVDAGAASAEVYVLRGEAYMQSGDYRNALADFDAALEKDPQNALAYYDRSILYSRLEDYTAALNDINNALAANTVNPVALLQMRDLYAKRGQLNLWVKNWEGAVADYTNSLARPEGSVNPSVYAERAEAYTALGNYAGAIEDYQSAIRVISEQIQGAPTMEERESLSSNAMSYFEKSAALNLNLGNVDAARSDLESSYTIAVALKDTETVERLQRLIAELASPVEVDMTVQETVVTPDAEPVQETVPEQQQEVQTPAPSVEPDVQDAAVSEEVVSEPVTETMAE